MAFLTQTNLGGFANQSLKNKIINGDFNIWQRGISFGAIGSSDYHVDRFCYYKVGTMVHTVSQDTDIPTLVESGYKSNYSLKIDCTTADTSMAAGDFCVVGQLIEGYNFAPMVGKTCTLSFWVKATKTGIYSVAFSNGGNDNSYVSEYTVNSSDTWEKKEIQVTFNYSSGTWYYTNGIGLLVWFPLCIGTTYSTSALNQWGAGYHLASNNQVNACDSTSNNFWLSQVQLEISSEATLFESRSISQELALCQRYCEVYTGENQYLTSGVCRTTSLVYAPFTFKMVKRSAPTISLNTVGTIQIQNKTGEVYAGTVFTGSAASVNSCRLNVTVDGSPLTVGEVGMVYLTDTGKLIMDSEL